jgi:glycosyltransferase involved in cell wall biosynthesis
MAAGVPVVASDLPVTREIITDGVEGRLVRADRPADLARVIRVLLEYPDQLRAMGERARQRIARGLTWTHAIDRLTDLYRALIPELQEAACEPGAVTPGGVSDGGDRLATHRP